MMDFVFGDDLALRYSLAIVAPLVLLLAAIVLRLGFAPFEQTKAYLFAAAKA